MSGRRKKAYSVEFKLSVVSKAETSSIRAVAREAGVDEKWVREWKGQKMELEEMMQKQARWYARSENVFEEVAEKCISRSRKS